MIVLRKNVKIHSETLKSKKYFEEKHKLITKCEYKKQIEKYILVFGKLSHCFEVKTCISPVCNSCR